MRLSRTYGNFFQPKLNRLIIDTIEHMADPVQSFLYATGRLNRYGVRAIVTRALEVADLTTHRDRLRRGLYNVGIDCHSFRIHDAMSALEYVNYIAETAEDAHIREYSKLDSPVWKKFIAKFEGTARTRELLHMYTFAIRMRQTTDTMTAIGSVSDSTERYLDVLESVRNDNDINWSLLDERDRLENTPIVAFGANPGALRHMLVTITDLLRITLWSFVLEAKIIRERTQSECGRTMTTAASITASTEPISDEARGFLV